MTDGASDSGRAARGVDGARSADAAIAALPIAEVRDDSRLVRAGRSVRRRAGDRRRRAAVHRRRRRARRASRWSIEADDAGRAPARASRRAVVSVPNARPRAGRSSPPTASARPSALTLLAVTGTNGKTTTTYLVEAMLRGGGRAPGCSARSPTARPAWRAAAPAPLTTPGALMLHALLAEMRAVGDHRRRVGGDLARAGAGAPRWLPRSGWRR